MSEKSKADRPLKPARLRSHSEPGGLPKRTKYERDLTAEERTICLQEHFNWLDGLRPMQAIWRDRSARGGYCDGPLRHFAMQRRLTNNDYKTHPRLGVALEYAREIAKSLEDKIQGRKQKRTTAYRANMKRNRRKRLPDGVKRRGG